MDYEKKYKEALERLRNAFYNNNSRICEEYRNAALKIIEPIFPELAESEDERIRKALINGFNKLDKSAVWYNGITNYQIIAWLEQGKQKPDTNYLLSWSEIDEKMLQSLEGIVKDYWAKAEQEKNEIKIREASNVSYFLKTIQKSPLCWIKCSDELPNRDGTYLVVTDGRHNDVYDIARYDSIEGWHKASDIIYWMPIPQLNNKSIIEQKPAWSEKDILMKCEIINVLQKTGNYEKEINWLKTLKDRYTWRPSEEQMDALHDAAVYVDKSMFPYPKGILMKLYKQLKKLREE